MDLSPSHKVVSKSVDDGFGSSMDVYNNTVVVGAPTDHDEKGSITIINNDGTTTKVEGTTGGGSFGAGE